VQAWVEDRGGGNVALRMPPNVLGIDVDDYKDKPGAAVLDELEKKHGTLPATWTSSSRGGRSGIRFYRIPEGLHWPGILGPGIETIRYDHRYAVAWPSIHPEGGTYRWTRPDGAIALDEVPDVDELPALPQKWVEALTHGTLATDQPKADLTDGAASAWLLARNAMAAPCRVLHKVTEQGMADLTSGGSRHDAALALTNRIVWLTGEGHDGAGRCLQVARAAFVAAVAGERDDLDGEWDRMVSGAIRLSAAAHPDKQPDPCDDPFAGLIPKEQSWQHPSQSTPKSQSPISAASPTHSNGSSTSSATALLAPGSNSSATTTGSPTSPTTSSDGRSGPTDAAADDLTEQQIRRNQAAAQALEQMRAQRAAVRLLEQEDEDGTVADRVRRKILDDKAALAYKVLTEPPAPPFDAGTLRELLARPADPPMRMDSLIPWESSTLVVAKRKTGKTTLILNYVRSMLNGDSFLDTFATRPIADDATIALLNYEVSAAMVSRWADEVGIDQDRFYIVNLRGRRNPLSSPDDRRRLVDELRDRNTEAIICDPFGRAYTGKSQNDSGEVQAWLLDLEMFARAEVGATDVVLAAHAGWNGERTRGASALEDWGDVIITLTSDEEDESQRYLKALGRDVEIDEDRLNFDSFTRSLSLSGMGSRKEAKKGRQQSDLFVYLARAAREQPGASCAELERVIRAMDDAPHFQNGAAAKAAIWGEGQGLMRTERGPRNALLCWAVDPHLPSSPTSPAPPRGKSTTSPTSPYREVGRS
jgi:transcriptional regulator of met regulon